MLPLLDSYYYYYYFLKAKTSLKKQYMRLTHSKLTLQNKENSTESLQTYQYNINN